MKKLLIIVALLGVVFVGCKTVPTPEKVSRVSHAIGVASGVACKIANINQKETDIIVEVMNSVKTTLPTTNETYVIAWTPLIKAEIARLYEEGTITDDEVIVAENILIFVSNGVDYMFMRHPKWKQYETLTSTSINGFIDGFVFVVTRPYMVSGTTEEVEVEMDQEAYEYFCSIFVTP